MSAPSSGGSRPGRDTYQFKVLKARLRDERRPRCWLCSQLIDYDLEYPDPGSFSPDHIVPVTVDPSLAEVYSNLAPSHLDCNRRRQNGEPIAVLGAGAHVQQW